MYSCLNADYTKKAHRLENADLTGLGNSQEEYCAMAEGLTLVWVCSLCAEKAQNPPGSVSGDF